MPCGVCNQVRPKCRCANGYLPTPRKSLSNVPLSCPWNCGEVVKRKDLEQHAASAHGAGRKTE